MTSISEGRSTAVRLPPAGGPVDEVRIEAKVSRSTGKTLVPAATALGVQVSDFSADPGLLKTKVALTARGPREAVDRLVSTLGDGIQVLDRAEVSAPPSDRWSKRAVDGSVFTFANDLQRNLFELPLDALVSTAMASRSPHGPTEEERNSSVALVFKLIEDLGPKLRAASAQSEDLARRPDAGATARFFAATRVLEHTYALVRAEATLRHVLPAAPGPGSASFFFRPENGAIAAGVSPAFAEARALGAAALGRLVDLASSVVAEATTAQDAKTLGQVADWALRLAGAAWESDGPALEKLLDQPLDAPLFSAGPNRALHDDGLDANLRLLGEGLFRSAQFGPFDAGASAPAARLRAVATTALRACAELAPASRRAQLEKAASRLETFGTL
ncbi:MAG: hypothetical protein K1X89_22065 [Myxococcaceae bacterium]|nr:hypothetical protein [Myxococcaceae bacterium]